MIIVHCKPCGFTHTSVNALDDLVSTLTPQELKIFALMATGPTNEELGAKLYVVVRTVKFHLSNIMAKLCLENRAQVAVVANHWLAITCPSGRSPRAAGGAEIPSL